MQSGRIFLHCSTCPTPSWMLTSSNQAHKDSCSIFNHYPETIPVDGDYYTTATPVYSNHLLRIHPGVSSLTMYYIIVSVCK